MTSKDDERDERDEREATPQVDDDTGGMKGTRGGTAEDPSRGDVGAGTFTDTDFDGDGRPESRTDGGG